MRIRKFSTIDRAHPIFEITDDAGGAVYFDVSSSDVGNLEIAFSDAIVPQIMLVKDFEQMLNEARRLATEDLNSD